MAVWNFITRDEFEGFEIQTNSAFVQESEVVTKISESSGGRLMIAQTWLYPSSTRIEID